MKGAGPAAGRRRKRSVKLFISYSHLNKVWMDRLKPLLDGFQYDARMTQLGSGLDCPHAWHDRELTAGNQWDGEIKSALAEMDIFVPLVSTHFLSSSYIRSVELPEAEERHAAGKVTVVPIVLYDTNLEQSCPFLDGFNRYPAFDRWWSSYPDPFDALRLIDDALWEAIAGVR